MKLIYASLLFLLVSCGHQQYLQVSKQTVDRTSLASTFARSPDPDQATPPTGEKLYISWYLPFSLDPKDYHLTLSILYKNLSQEEKIYPLPHRAGFLSFPLLNTKYKETKGFQAYKVELTHKDGTVLDIWQHQMWVTLL